MRAGRLDGRVGAYLYALGLLAREGKAWATSDEISRLVGTNATQVRRDVSRLLGHSGKRGVGFGVERLAAGLRERRRIGVVGDGAVARMLLSDDGVEAMLAALGFDVLAGAATSRPPDAFVVDYSDPDLGASVSAMLAAGGAALIVNFGCYAVRADPARVVNAHPLALLAEAVA